MRKLLVLVSFVSCLSTAAVADTEMAIVSCGSPLPIGSTFTMRNSQNTIIGRATGQSNNSVIYYDKYGRIIAKVFFRKNDCEVRDRTNKIVYRGKWSN